jgi:hypothetical protein
LLLHIVAAALDPSRASAILARRRADAELVDQAGESFALFRHRGTRRGRPLRDRGVVSRRLIHRLDGDVDVFEPRRLFLGAGGAGAEDVS